MVSARTDVPVSLPEWRHNHRYGLYTVRKCGTCGGSGVVGLAAPTALSHIFGERCPQCDEGRELVLLACADTPAGVGTAIVTLGEDAHEAGAQPDCVGVLDGRERRWLAHPRWS